MWIDLLLVIAGIGLLTLGGEVLISGALGFARRLQISTLLTGLVVLLSAVIVTLTARLYVN